MSPIKSISEVKDLSDLIDLYANLDRNRDGLLGPEEVRPEEVAAGDRGGIGSANHDVKDGFLSPWEVAQMRGFKWEDVRPLRIANQLHGRTFEEMTSLPRDVEVGGKRFRSGSALRFHENGTVRDGVLQAATTIKGIEIPAGSMIRLNQHREPVEATLAAPTLHRGLTIPAGTLVRFNTFHPEFISSEENPITQDGVAYTKVVSFFELGTVRTLAQETEIPLFAPPSQDAMLRLAPSAELTYDMDRTLLDVKIAAPTKLFETTLSAKTELRILQTTDVLPSGIIAQGEVLVGPARFRELAFQRHEKHRTGILAEDATFQINGLASTFKAGSYLEFDDPGIVRAGVLAAAVQSPYGTGIIPAGSSVDFREDGALIEGTRECLRALFPRIPLSGSLSSEQLKTVITGLSQLPASVVAEIRGIQIDAKETLSRKFGSTSITGYADPDALMIHLSDDPMDLTVATVIHEASHNHHHVLQRTSHERIARATRNLDLLSLSDQAADVRISGEIIARSIDGRWSRTSGTPFSYSLGDELGAVRSLHTFLGRPESERTPDAARPRDGFLLPYGRVSLWEDIATAAEEAYAHPQRFAQLIDASSTYYRGNPDQRRFASVYRGKLELLHAYGFITDAAYRKIAHRAPAHPKVAAFCSTVNCP